MTMRCLPLGARELDLPHVAGAEAFVEAVTAET